MKQYSVTGMSCAACSARVEKAVSKVPCVTACSVSLLTNSMGVEGDVNPMDIISAVENAGYGASVKGSDAAPAAGTIKSDGKSYVHVYCADGSAISLDEIQMAGKKRMKIKDFLLGFRNIEQFRFI